MIAFLKGFIIAGVACGLIGGTGYLVLKVGGTAIGGALMKLIAKSPRLIKFFELDPSDYEDTKKAPTAATAGAENLLNNNIYPSIVSNRLGIRKVETK